jgi:hypothetical protein
MRSAQRLNPFDDNQTYDSNVQTDYQIALNQLFNTIANLPSCTHPWSLFQSGLQVYCAVRAAKSNSKNVIPNEKLTEILSATARLIKAPQQDRKYRKEIDAYHKLSNNIRQYSLGKIVAASMLCLIGTLLIVASGLITAVTFGGMIPVGVLGGMLGISMITGGIAAGLSGGVGMSCLMGSGMLFYKIVEKNPLRNAMEKVEASVREIYSFHK